MVLDAFTYFVWFCGFYYGAFRVESCLALCLHVVVYSVLFSIAITSLGEERTGIGATSRENLSSGFATRYDSNWPAQRYKLARVLKF